MKLPPEDRQRISDRFSAELWPLNKVGNPQLALSELIHSMEDDLLFSGGQITFDIVLAKYKEHLSYVKIQNVDRNPQYHSKTDDLSTFIMRKRFNEDFIPSTVHETDRYLYGN